MHPVINLDELTKLTTDELLRLEAALRDLILDAPLDETDLRRCLLSLSNAVYERSLRTTLPPTRATPAR